MKNLLPTLLAALFFGSLTAQNLQLGWGYTNGSTGADGANDLAIDAAGNTYVTGYFSGTVDFDKGPGTANLSVAPGQTAKDAFVLKLDPQGNYVWAIRIGGIDNYDQVGTKIALDTAGNVVVAGTFYGNVLLPPNNTNYNSSTTKPGSFMVKIDTAGTALWARAWANASSEMIIEDFTIDANNRIVAVGEFTSTVNFSTNATPNNKTSNGGKDFFVMQLGQNGNLQNVQSVGNVNDEYAFAVTNTVGMYYITGTFKGTVDFDFSSGISSLSSISNSIDIYLLIVGTNMSFSNVLGYGGSLDGDLPRSIYRNGSDLYLLGLFQGSADLDPNPNSTLTINGVGQDCYLQKLDLAGNLIWVKTFGDNSYMSPWGLKANPSGDVYFTGRFSGTFDANPSPNNTFNLSASLNSGFLIGLNTLGDFITAVSFETGSLSIKEALLSIDINSQGHLFTCGTFRNPFDLDPGPSTSMAINAGQDDMLVLKMLSCSDTIVSASKTLCGTYTLSNGQVITQSGNYQDTLQSTNGCDSIVSLNLTVNPSPSTTVAWQGATLQLTNSSPTNTHQWLDCTTGQAISGATGTSYTPTGNGSFAVVVSNGTCSDTSVCETLTNFSVPEAANIPVKMYPNPTTGILHLESPQPWERVEVVDMLGKLVLNTKKEDIDLSHLPTGMYLVKVYFEEGVVLERVVKR